MKQVSGRDGGTAAFLLFIVSFGGGLAYFALLESMYGATPGKMLLGLRVENVDGSRIDLRTALIRNVLRLVDGLFMYLVAAILVWKSPTRQRLGDRVANTVVVRKGSVPSPETVHA